SALELHPDETGIPGSRFVQANLSFSRAGVLRGLHFHKKQLDHWVVIDGEVFVALVDLRSRVSRPAVSTRVLGADETVTIPVRVGVAAAHAVVIGGGRSGPAQGARVTGDHGEVGGGEGAVRGGGAVLDPRGGRLIGGPADGDAGAADVGRLDVADLRRDGVE